MIRVLHPGIYCTVQDKGRVGFAKKGVPISGYMDSYAAEMGNILLKNRKHSAVIEITYGQGKFEFLEDTYVCLMGGNFSPRINTFEMPMNRVVEVKKNDVLSFGRRVYGARTYLAVQGGIQCEAVLKSQSFCQGITKLRLEKGDELPILKQQLYQENTFSKIRAFADHFEDPTLECFKGPEFDQLNQLQQSTLLKTFTLSDDNNRVGYRLNEELKNNLSAIITSGVLPGTVQLTPSGKLIVLMRDCQVTGGYPRVLQLSDYAISKLSQKISGDKVQFILK